jgi:hypothetical protein
MTIVLVFRNKTNEAATKAERRSALNAGPKF